jgi:periplasmic divalent cation tolerance protein
VNPADVYLVITNLPDRDSAGKLAHALVEKHLAACINVFSPCRSVFRWKGRIEDAEEFTMLIKTTRERYPALEAAIRAGHPYELPEIIAVPLAGGLPAYFEWVESETSPSSYAQIAPRRLVNLLSRRAGRRLGGAARA